VKQVQKSTYKLEQIVTIGETDKVEYQGRSNYLGEPRFWNYNRGPKLAESLSQKKIDNKEYASFDLKQFQYSFDYTKETGEKCAITLNILFDVNGFTLNINEFNNASAYDVTNFRIQSINKIDSDYDEIRESLSNLPKSETKTALEEKAHNLWRKNIEAWHQKYDFESISIMYTISNNASGFCISEVTTADVDPCLTRKEYSNDKTNKEKTIGKQDIKYLSESEGISVAYTEIITYGINATEKILSVYGQIKSDIDNIKKDLTSCYGSISPSHTAKKAIEMNGLKSEQIYFAEAKRALELRDKIQSENKSLLSEKSTLEKEVDYYKTHPIKSIFCSYNSKKVNEK
jgi:hypothetical protein